MSNSTGGPFCRHTSIKRMYAIFDRLPREVRDALNNAAFHYCPVCLARGPLGLGDIAALLAASDAAEENPYER